MHPLCSPSIPCLQAVVCVRHKLHMSLPSAARPWGVDLGTAARKTESDDCGYGSREAPDARWWSCIHCAVRLYRVCKRWCVCATSCACMSLTSAAGPWGVDLGTAARKTESDDCGYGSREAPDARWWSCIHCAVRLYRVCNLRFALLSCYFRSSE